MRYNDGYLCLAGLYDWNRILQADPAEEPDPDAPVFTACSHLPARCPAVPHVSCRRYAQIPHRWGLHPSAAYSHQNYKGTDLVCAPDELVFFSLLCITLRRRLLPKVAILDLIKTLQI